MTSSLSIVSALEVPKSAIREHLLWRDEFLARCEEDADYRADVLEACRRDILFEINALYWTYDPRGYEDPVTHQRHPDLKHLPFITYPFQDEYVLRLDDHIERQEDLLTEKSRDMGVSWLIVAVFLHRWRWKADHFKIGSRKEELVDRFGDLDTHFERIRYLRKHLPNWWLPLGFDSREHETYMKLINPEDQNAIVGEATNDNFSRQGRYRAIMLDEYAFVEHPEMIWRACGDSTKCRLPISTPNGKQNYFGRLRFSGQIKVATLHWRQHPHKTQAWYEQEKTRRPAQDIARELDLSYETQAGKPFYGSDYVEAGQLSHFRDVQLPDFKNEMWLLLRGWDFGYHRPACVVTTLDPVDRWLWLYAIMGCDVLLDEFRDHSLRILKELFPNAKYLDYGDPAGKQKSDKSAKTCEEILAEAGIKMISRPSNEPEASYASRKRIIQGKLKLYIQGLPALVIDKSRALYVPEGVSPKPGFVYGTQLLHEAMKGGYAYPAIKENQPEDEMPNKDGYYDNPMNAAEYIAVNHFTSESGSGMTLDFSHIAR